MTCDRCGRRLAWDEGRMLVVDGQPAGWLTPGKAEYWCGQCVTEVHGAEVWRSAG